MRPRLRGSIRQTIRRTLSSFQTERFEMNSLLSGYEPNRFNWLAWHGNSSWKSICWSARKMRVFSNRVRLSTCRIWLRLDSTSSRLRTMATRT